MCLAMPAEVIELKEKNRALVNLAGIKKEVCLDLVDDVSVGDYVIIHVGYALTKLDQHEARKTLALFSEIRSQQ